jgi:hypothetical protein
MAKSFTENKIRFFILFMCHKFNDRLGLKFNSFHAGEKKKDKITPCNLEL